MASATYYVVDYTDAHNEANSLVRQMCQLPKLMQWINDTPGLDLVSVRVMEEGN